MIQGVIAAGRVPFLTYPEVPRLVPDLKALYAAEPDGLFWFAGDSAHPALPGAIEAIAQSDRMGYTNVFKYAVSCERPNGQDERSFPSGHTSNAFALAAVVERHYGWKAGIPGYALASLVGVSRLQRNKHYLSDVLAGATLGYVVGRTVVRVNGGAIGGSKGPQVSLNPVVGRRTRAPLVSVAF